MKIRTVLILTIGILLIYQRAFALEEKTPHWTPMGEIVNIVQNSGHFEYHETYFDPEKSREDLEKNFTQADENWAIVEKDGIRKVIKYQVSKEVMELIEKAKQMHSRTRYEKAEELLKKASEADPEYSMVYVFIGNTYHSRENYKEAINWYNKAIEKNPVNFTAYKMRANCHFKNNQLDLCKEDLKLAIICNRNDKQAMEQLENLGKSLNFRIYKKTFVPLYSLEKMDNGKIRIYIDKDQVIRWMPYSFCKAVWRYEPNYFEKKTGEKEYHLTQMEEMECIINTISAYESFIKRGQFDRDPMLERIKKIKERFFIKEFVLFEIIAPQQPDALLTLDKVQLTDMLDYIEEFILLKERIAGDG